VNAQVTVELLSLGRDSIGAVVFCTMKPGSIDIRDQLTIVSKIEYPKAMQKHVQ